MSLYADKTLKVVCQNCHWQGLSGTGVAPIPDLEDRLVPGDIVPACECPKCGALCYGYEADGNWFFQMSSSEYGNEEFGPYDSEEEAWAGMRRITEGDEFKDGIERRFRPPFRKEAL